MNAQPHEIAAALLDVRKAYRLLHDYQRAALDAVNYIGTQLGFTYEGGYSNFSDCSPRNGKGSLDNWAWDWLNLYFHEFHFIKKVDSEETLNLSIWLFSDTGYYCSSHPEIDETDLSTFAKPEESNTKIGFILYRQWREEYEVAYEDEPVRLFLKEGGKLPPLLEKAGIRATLYDFSEVAGQQSTDVLLGKLIQFGNAHGFPLTRNPILTKSTRTVREQ
ncbi:MAG: hypothetical protein EOP84_24740 [Verrucomicrobiaceae bacterium]|nr:MAG: hypothetical protein EOP84_24740 [Verrucomicrobiaceae bacterium]